MRASGQEVADTKKSIRFLAALLAFCLALGLTGCFAGSIDELLSLPQPSEEYLQLQELIDVEIAAGSEFSAPISGNYRQSVQMHDLDGDGAEEALVFLRSAEQMLKICIYTPVAGEYALAATIHGEGTAIGSVEYANLNGAPGTELVVAWQVAGDLRLLKVYSMTAWSGAVLLTADCSSYRVYDITGDGTPRLLCIRFDDTGAGLVDMYAFGEDNAVETFTAGLSEGVTAVSSLITGRLSDESPALFVEGTAENLYYTDIIVFDNGLLRNISLRRITGTSAVNRVYPVNCTDIDSDRVVEAPFAAAMPSQSESSVTYWLFDWYSFNIRGYRALDLSTYHCYSEGWYLVVPEEMRKTITVRREESLLGEPTVVLSLADEDTGEIRDMVQIFTLTGENRHDRARLAGRFVLLENDTTIYAANLLSGDFTEEELSAGFRLIRTDWNTDLS